MNERRQRGKAMSDKQIGFFLGVVFGAMAMSVASGVVIAQEMASSVGVRPSMVRPLELEPGPPAVGVGLDGDWHRILVDDDGRVICSPFK